MRTRYELRAGGKSRAAAISSYVCTTTTALLSKVDKYLIEGEGVSKAMLGKDKMFLLIICCWDFVMCRCECSNRAIVDVFYSICFMKTCVEDIHVEICTAKAFTLGQMREIGEE
jgi:hypothetical protein